MKEKLGYKWEVLALLWIAYFLNQADRQAFNILIPLIKVDLHLTDIQIGSIATVFNLIFALLVSFGGYIGDLFSRKWMIVSSILLWSIATMFTGLSSSMMMMILMRSIATGGGEALFAPANYALLASYHKNTRALSMSIHQTAYYLGIILCGYMAGFIGELYGWRSVFYIFGAVGIIHGIVLIFMLKDKTDIEKDKTKEKISYLEVVKVFISSPTALLLTIAFSGLIFVLVGYLTWIPTFLYEKFNMSLSQAGFKSMFYTNIFAFLGIIIAGKYSDKLAMKDPRIRLLIQGIGLLCGAPFILLLSNSNVLSIIYIGFVGFGFTRALFDANTYAILYDVIPEKYQSSASGILIMVGFSVGSLSPLLLGYLKPLLGLSFCFSLFAIVWVLSGILLLIAYRYYFRKDYERIHG
jgi:MFS family permease